MKKLWLIISVAGLVSCHCEQKTNHDIATQNVASENKTSKSTTNLGSPNYEPNHQAFDSLKRKLNQQKFEKRNMGYPVDTGNKLNR